MIKFFDKTILSTLGNFLPYEIIVCDEKDLPCFNNKIKSLIDEKLRTEKGSRKSIYNSQLFETLNSL